MEERKKKKKSGVEQHEEKEATLPVASHHSKRKIHYKSLVIRLSKKTRLPCLNTKYDTAITYCVFPFALRLHLYLLTFIYQ